MMRNKFTELINAGVASFSHKPLGDATPNLDPVCRIYNMYWGMATDTHMSMIEDRRYITGSLLKDTRKWFLLNHACTWGGMQWSQSGFSTLSEVFYAYSIEPKVTTLNGDYAIELVPCDYDAPCCGFGCDKVCTTESALPVQLRFMPTLRNIMEEATSIRNLVQLMNESKQVPGNNWHVFDGKITDNSIIIEMSADKGIIVHDNELQQLLDNEGIGELYLVQYKNFFKVDSEDKLWKNALQKCKFNSIKAKSFNELTPQQWFDEIKSIIATIS